MSAAIEIDGRAVEVNFVSEELKEVIELAESKDYRAALHAALREVTRLSEEIVELEDRLEVAT